MRGIPENKEHLFKEALNSFKGTEDIYVTDEKLETFLKATKDIEIPKEERLRQLAISLEHEKFEKGWKSLSKIYQKASEINPKDSYIFHSWGISASEWFESWMTTDLTEQLEIFSESEQVLSKALALEPENSDIAYSLGIINYTHPSHLTNRTFYLEKAINWFSLAIKWNNQNVMAHLYLAHCYHDFAYHINPNYWENALNAYKNVDQHALARDFPVWRVLKCREQIAACYCWSGNQEEAVYHFSKFLDEIEVFELDEYNSHEAIINFDEIVDSLTKKLNNPVLLKRTKAQVIRYGFENLYQEFFDRLD